ncbi:N-acetyl-alpha-D-glucosaminyl-diphospho-ditrans,octacis-undecaprenol 4-epimerase [Dickeya dianthicola]|uniref:NAD-dependent dehydratase n=2 Tax=Dickeya dianthicola TaxID=204039 RepID=A0AAP2CXJ6_9GAMM|nr:NAD-dependent epimerase/dehydratase family protein [Dickeya dianthicola]ATO31695.1 UDP-glucose 4-epimerase [Dickeya dianthicola RNS04.9]AYC17615.1 N-acetyl-alpha-D-glucosaminyl-diphospho-ditrans,octacis-undecaprenol 4-epimerase [Dickeya dianthicola]MBI0437834.1 NAD-dependent epimerase/dehydratase family protein [Dickeya dianthicola]MBI0447983.1 NAD-dependent epimerase/dehydratase family protein [Dickeya dianthicola]MBI0452600.1 NAD-dependent epimerase/dehydratase family protein [Dickeya dia
MKILITGSRGFIGRRLAALAGEQGITCVLHCSERADVSDSSMIRANLTAATDWMPALQGVDAVVHCAARVHQMQDGGEALQLYRETNVAGTVRLAQQAAQAGVKRFVFLSSIKVNGELTQPGRPFQPEVVVPPADPYGLSKYEAEQALLRLARETGLEVVIIRPPLVYGPGAKANFRAMMNWVNKGVPLPLAAVHNQRSLVFVDNLVDLILLSVRHPQAPGRVWLASDDHDVSTADLLADMAAALGVKNRCWPLPPWVLKSAAALLGKSAVAERLLGSLQVDIRETRQRLGWQPAVPYHQAIAATARAFLAETSGVSESVSKQG